MSYLCAMTSVMVMQGRELSGADIGLIRGLLDEHPEWGRTRLSEELCERWDWRNAQGRLKDMAARTLLLKLERAGHIRLPPRRGPSSNGLAQSSRARRGTAERADSRRVARPAAVDRERRRAGFGRPAAVQRPAGPLSLPRPSQHGGREPPVSGARPAGSAGGLRAVRVGGVEVRGPRRLPRLGSRHARTQPARADQQHALSHPGWVEVPHLASHVLGLIARRIRADWQAKYGHPVHALETFVDRSRFQGTCYRAANWLRLGATRGRTRNDRAHRIRAAVKDVYLYPLSPDFRRELCA